MDIKEAIARELVKCQYIANPHWSHLGPLEKYVEQEWESFEADAEAVIQVFKKYNSGELK